MEGFFSPVVVVSPAGFPIPTSNGCYRVSCRERMTELLGYTPDTSLVRTRGAGRGQTQQRGVRQGQEAVSLLVITPASI